jgi:hypothetical protein
MDLFVIHSRHIGSFASAFVFGALGIYTTAGNNSLYITTRYMCLREKIDKTPFRQRR